MSSPITSPTPATARRLPRLADAAMSRARLTVVPRVRSRAPRVPFVLLVSALLLGGVIGLLVFNTSMQQSAFAASGLERRATDLAAQEQALRTEVESLRNAQRVAEQAQAMGMVLPSSSCFLVLSGPQPECAAAPEPQRLRLQPAPPVKPAILAPKDITVPAKPHRDRDRTGDRAGDGTGDGADNRRDTGSASPNSGTARGRNDGKPDRARAGGR